MRLNNLFSEITAYCDIDINLNRFNANHSIFKISLVDHRPSVYPYLAVIDTEIIINLLLQVK